MTPQTDVASPRRRSGNAATDLALIATFAALIAVCAILPAITVGGAVPITLQTFGTVLAGAVLGARRGFLAVLLYLAVGAVGLPVFAGGSAGIAPFVGPSAGFLVAMPLAAALCGFIVERLPRKRVGATIVLIALAGIGSNLVLTHPLGILGMSWLGDLTLQQALIADMAFWPGDIVKNVLVGIVAASVHRAFPTILPPRTLQA